MVIVRPAQIFLAASTAVWAALWAEAGPVNVSAVSAAMPSSAVVHTLPAERRRVAGCARLDFGQMACRRRVDAVLVSMILSSWEGVTGDPKACALPSTANLLC